MTNPGTTRPIPRIGGPRVEQELASLERARVEQDRQLLDVLRAVSLELPEATELSSALEARLRVAARATCVSRSAVRV